MTAEIIWKLGWLAETRKEYQEQLRYYNRWNAGNLNTVNGNMEQDAAIIKWDSTVRLCGYSNGLRRADRKNPCGRVVITGRLKLSMALVTVLQREFFF